MDWLEKERSISGKRLLEFIITRAILILCVANGIVCVLMFIGVDFPKPTNGEIYMLEWSFPITLAIGVVLEEFGFRLLPLAFTIGLIGNSSWILLVILCSSIVFGVAHGSMWHILVQGLVGVWLSIIFLKVGGFQRKYLRAWLICTAIHFCYNGIICLIVIFNGVYYI